MNYKQYNDYELIDKIRESDEDSKSIMMEKYQPVIYKMANQYYQKCSFYGYEYEDFIQEARIGLYRALIAYDEQKDSTFYSFVILCIQRSLSSFCRMISTASKNISIDYVDDIEDYNVEDVRSNTNTILKEKEQQTAFMTFLYELPFEIGAIMELRWNGFTYREIGSLLDIPSSTAEFKTRRARRTLKKILQRI